MTALEQVAERSADRKILWADFDAMLVDMDSALTSVAGFFGFETARHRRHRGRAADGPLLEGDRACVQRQPPARADRRNGGAVCARHVKDALAMLERAAEKSPLLARALARAQGGLMYRVLQILTDEEVAECRRIAKSASFVDGRISNPHNQAKHNEQLHEPATYQKSERPPAQGDAALTPNSWNSPSRSLWRRR